jgi:uncharacterized protein (DUF1330 family)
MSAYVIVEFTVKNPEMYREKYAPIAGQTAKEHGGEVIAAGNWEVLHGDGSLTSGALVRFPDHETAVKWYNSPEYQCRPDPARDRRRMVYRRQRRRIAAGHQVAPAAASRP